MYGIVKFKLKDAMARYITRQVMSYGELKLVTTKDVIVYQNRPRMAKIGQD